MNTMRFRVTLAPWPDQNGSPPVLRYDYQHGISSMIYSLLIDAKPEFKGLHDATDYKYFTFSRLEVPRRRALSEGLAILCNDTYLWFSSVDDALAKTMANLLIRQQSVQFGGVKFAVVNVAVPASYEPRGQQETFVTMSPIVLRTDIDSEGTSKTWDLEPSDRRFVERLTANLRRKYERYYEKPCSGEVRVESITNTKQQRIVLGEVSHRAHLMDITIQGPPEILKFAHECGLGEKNSMGFGMVRLRNDAT